MRRRAGLAALLALSLLVGCAA
ncbi:MAG: hypothetical protein RLZZ341_1784, partial [Pseudomonadota bacterium]